jgi:GNAT superfamily N-acetyltransferase
MFCAGLEENDRTWNMARPGLSTGGEEDDVAIVYQRETYPDFGPAEFIDLLVRSTLAERRPVDEPETIRGMLEHAGLIITARQEGRLVGVARAISDFSYCTYLSDLAVDRDFQRRGIGKELIRLTHEAAGLHTTLILLSAPLARTYYPHIGMQFHDSCWIIPRDT